MHTRLAALLSLILLAGVAATRHFHHTPPPATTMAPATAQPPRECPHAERLARQYAPALAIAPDDELPRTVELLLDRAALVYNDGDRPAHVVPVTPARLDQLANHPEAFLSLPPPVDDTVAQRRLYEQAVASDAAGRYAVTTYASVHCQANTTGLEGHTIVQYWLFYMYNDASNKHEGDWELIQVALDAAGRPQFAAYAQHNSYTWRDWSEVLIEHRAGPSDEEEHPRVYVARGSHASYFQYAPAGYGGDVVVDASDFVIPQVRLLPLPEGAEPATFGWLRFPGAWGSDVPAGNPCRVCERGPVGPAFNSGGEKWRTPLAWGGRRLNRDDLLAHGTARIVARTRGAVHFYDAQGRHTGPLPGGRMERAAAGVAHLTRPGSDTQIVLAPGLSASTPARVEIEGGVIDSLDVLLPDGSSALRMRAEHIDLGAKGRARIDLGSRGPALQIDLDGDGRYERSVPMQVSPAATTPVGGD